MADPLSSASEEETDRIAAERRAGERRGGGRYRLLERLGRGGMGAVWRAHDEVLDRPVAVKELFTIAELGDRGDVTGRVLREARAAGRISHPGIAAVYDVFEEDGHPWIVMELVPSRTLGATLREHGPLPPRRVAAISLQVLAALRAAHAAGVLHRDVKPDNVLLAADGRVVLTDFGIATLDGECSLTRTGVLLGTPAFIAPERAAGGRAERASDLWSLGVTMYVAVEGRAPFLRDHVLATMTAVLCDRPAPMRRAGPLAPIIDGLLRKDPRERLTAERLEPWLRAMAEPGTPEPARPGPRIPCAPPPPSVSTGDLVLPDTAPHPMPPPLPRRMPYRVPRLGPESGPVRTAGTAPGPYPRGAGPRAARTVRRAGAARRAARGQVLGLVAALTVAVGLAAGGAAYMTASAEEAGRAAPYQARLPGPSGGRPTGSSPGAPAPASGPPATGSPSPGDAHGRPGTARHTAPPERTPRVAAPAARTGPTRTPERPRDRTPDRTRGRYPAYGGEPRGRAARRGAPFPAPGQGRRDERRGPDRPREESSGAPRERAPGRIEPDLGAGAIGGAAR